MFTGLKRKCKEEIVITHRNVRQISYLFCCQRKYTVIWVKYSYEFCEMISAVLFTVLMHFLLCVCVCVCVYVYIYMRQSIHL